MKFENYLNEKVSKSEIDSIFRNKNILVGMEFEFYMDNNDSYEGEIAGYSYTEVYRAWDNFTDELLAWHEEMDDSREEVDKNIKDWEKINKNLL